MSAANADEEQSSSKFDISVGQFLGNKEMYLVIVIFVITAIVVYLVRRMEVDNAWTLAIISGALIQVAGLFVGYIVLGVTGKTLWLIVGNIISCLLHLSFSFVYESGLCAPNGCSLRMMITIIMSRLCRRKWSLSVRLR